MNSVLPREVMLYLRDTVSGNDFDLLLRDEDIDLVFSGRWDLVRTFLVVGTTCSLYV